MRIGACGETPHNACGQRSRAQNFREKKVEGVMIDHQTHNADAACASDNYAAQDSNFARSQ